MISRLGTNSRSAYDVGGSSFGVLAFLPLEVHRPMMNFPNVREPLFGHLRSSSIRASPTNGDRRRLRPSRTGALNTQPAKITPLHHSIRKPIELS